MKPKRIQLKRTKGWKLPRNAVVVSRPSRWGNPFHFKIVRESHPDETETEIRQRCVNAFRKYSAPGWEGFDQWIAPLRGKHLACWCRLCPEHRNGKPLGVECDKCQPCHADVLLSLARF